VPGLFSYNERVTLAGCWEHGYFAFVAVGAYNVGSIGLDAVPVQLHYLLLAFASLTGCQQQTLKTNGALLEEEGYCDLYNLPAPVAMTKGDHVGGFRLGSSIVLVFEAPADAQFVVAPGQKLKVGQPLLELAPRSAESPVTEAAAA
jgi:phosphatidylserine decarboxylase